MAGDGAYHLRETTGTSGLDQTVRDAIEILARHLIPHLIAGGLAVQQHGYYRVTLDADIIVPDILDAMELLTADWSGLSERYPGCEDTVRDRRNGVLINLLPADRGYRRTCKVPFPAPTAVTDIPQYVSLPKLISLKLDSWSQNPHRRLKDKADVIELIKTLHLPRNLEVDEPVRHLYHETWDALQAEAE
jgi:hypothetical protein